MNRRVALLLETVTAFRGTTPVRRFTISRCEAYSGAQTGRPVVY